MGNPQAQAPPHPVPDEVLGLVARMTSKAAASRIAGPRELLELLRREGGGREGGGGRGGERGRGDALRSLHGGGLGGRAGGNHGSLCV